MAVQPNPPIQIDPSVDDGHKWAFVNQNFQSIANTLQTNSFKIAKSGSVTTVISSIAGGATNTTTVAHGQSTTPGFLAYVTLPTNWVSVLSVTGITNLPTYAIAGDGLGGAHILQSVSARADSTNLYFDVINTTSGTQTGPYTYVFKYYALIETAT